MALWMSNNKRAERKIYLMMWSQEQEDQGFWAFANKLQSINGGVSLFEL